MTETRDTQKQLLHTLAELGGRQTADDDLVFEGKRFVIPEVMDLDDAIVYLDRHRQQAQEHHLFTKIFRYRPWDGAAALQTGLKKVFGTVGHGIRTPGFFSSRPPEMRNINVSPDETISVPWGRIEVPIFGLDGWLELSATNDPEWGPLFVLNAYVPKKFRHQVDGIFKVVEEELRTNSIYKGRAITGATDAEFVDLSGVDPSKVIYAEDVAVQLEANVWSLLRHSTTMRELGLPLKRAVLLEGPYGTGKTLGAFLTAKVAVENGWTFIYCRPAKDDLGEVMATARLYQPAVVFFEDVDTLASSGEADQVTRLLDLFDGITAKGTELMVVMTTNHPERIHKGMVRPGRLDAVIHIGALDDAGVEQMVRALVPDDLLARNIVWDEVGKAMSGYLPAFVKEAVDRAMRYAVARANGKPRTITGPDIVQAAEGLRPQLALMEGAGEGVNPDSLSLAVSKIVQEANDGQQVMINDNWSRAPGDPWATITIPDTNGS